MECKSLSYLYGICGFLSTRLVITRPKVSRLWLIFHIILEPFLSLSHKFLCSELQISHLVLLEIIVILVKFAFFASCNGGTFWIGRTLDFLDHFKHFLLFQVIIIFRAFNNFRTLFLSFRKVLILCWDIF